MTFHDANIRKMMDLKVFVDTESDIRLARRLMRDIRKRLIDKTLNKLIQKLKKVIEIKVV